MEPEKDVKVSLSKNKNTHCLLYPKKNKAITVVNGINSNARTENQV